MKATTFILRRHERIGELLRVVERERHLRAPMLGDLVDEILSFLAVEEDLFYPSLAARACEEPEAHALDGVRERIPEEHAAILDLLDSRTEGELEEGLRRLASAASAHGASDRALVPLAERALGERELEELGARMARSYRESVSASRGFT
jgi:hypothetical protein